MIFPCFGQQKPAQVCHHLERLVFEKEGQPRLVEEFLRILSHIWTTPNSLAINRTLVKLDEVFDKDCDKAQHYLTTGNNILEAVDLILW